MNLRMGFSISTKKKAIEWNLEETVVSLLVALVVVSASQNPSSRLSLVPPQGLGSSLLPSAGRVLRFQRARLSPPVFVHS